MTENIRQRLLKAETRDWDGLYGDLQKRVKEFRDEEVLVAAIPAKEE